MKNSVSQFLHETFSPMRRHNKAERTKRSHSTTPLQLHSVNCTPRCQMPNSTSQTMLRPTPNFATLPRSAHMLASPSAMSPSLVQQIGELRLDVQKSEKFEQDDLVIDGTDVLSGSAEALLKRLIPTRDFTPNENYIFTLLLNIRTTMSPDEIMQKIVQYCMFAQNSSSENFGREGRNRMFSHILTLCQQWTSTIPHDFRSEHMKTRLDELLGLCSVDKTYRQRANELQSQLKSTLSKLDRYEKAVRNLRNISDTPQRPVQSETIVGLCALTTDAKSVAQQLTHIELERFSMVGVDDIVYSLANSDLSNIGRDRCDRTSNITFYVEWFNRLSALVATEVLRHNRKKHRAEVIEFWIDVAKECCEIGNFNSLMAIVAGLLLPSVERLKRTHSRVDKCKLQILQHQLDPSGNFLSYRATLKAAIWRVESMSAQKFVIPFFVLLLKDLFMIYHGQPRVLHNGHLNFSAFTQLADQLRSVVQWKAAQCTFPKQNQILQYLLVAPVYGEKEAMLISFDCEPAEKSAEREQYKKLKTPR